MRTLRTLLTALLVLCATAALAKDRHYEGIHGDIIFQTLPKSPLVNAIEAVSDSFFSHCGIIVVVDGQPMVLEAMDTVHMTPFPDWVAQGEGYFEVYRPKMLSAEEKEKFIQAAMKFLRAPYDYHYKMDDAYIYCSELVYKAYKLATGKELASPQKLGDLNWRKAAAFIMVWELGIIPMEREIITPVALTRSPLLERVFSTYTGRW